MAQSASVPSPGAIPLNEEEVYNYSDADALALSEFDFLSWLSKKGIGGGNSSGKSQAQ